MLIRTKFFGILRKLTKKQSLTIEISEGSSVLDLIFTLAKTEDLDITQLLTKKKTKLRAGLNIFVNGRNITHLDGLNTKLSDRDLISILPVTGGG